MRNTALYCVLFLVTIGCSTKKNAGLNRFYHSTASKFNPIFNGDEALRYGILDISQSYQDNYWLQLSVDPYFIPEPYEEENTSNEFFDRAEEKAVLTVQKHSMLIEGEQRNKQISNAYLLLGKARYFNGRYLQSIEAFTYLIKNMFGSKQAIEAEIWRAKSYLALGQYDRAVKEFKNISKSAILKPNEFAIVQSALADALLKDDKNGLATKPLLVAYATEKSAFKRGRYAYLLGQLYENLKYSDSAVIAYQQVLDLNRRIPRELWIHAKLSQLRNNVLNNENTILAYKKLMRSDEDRRFRDKIYYFYGSHLIKESDTINGENALEASLLTNTRDRYLKSLIYEQLATNRLDQIAFVTAGEYLDSTLQNLTPKTRRFRKISRQRKKLDDIINYEKTIVETDSILQLMSMSVEAKKLVISKYIENVKKRREKEAANAKSSVLSNGLSLEFFYFYNSRQLKAGKLDFKQNWGDISLTDNWKYNPVVDLNFVERLDSSTENTQIDPELNPDTYLAQIPSETVRDSLIMKKNEAYFEAGLAYKEQFLIKSFAITRFESLINANPDERFIPSTLYHLYQLYNGNKTQEIKWSSRIINEYPHSDYAKMIQNPAGLAKTIDENQVIFSNAKELFRNQQYEVVIKLSDQYIPQLTDRELQANWAVLRATSLGRLDGLEIYKKELTAIVLNYPKTKSAIKAQTQIDQFAIYDKNEPNEYETAKIIIFRPPEKNEETKEYKKWLESWFDEQGISNKLKVSIDVFDRKTETLVVHGFSSKLSANETLILLKQNSPRLLSSKNIVVLASQYRNAIISKHLEQLEN